MTLKELRAWLDGKAQDATLSTDEQYTFYKIQQEFESDFDYPLSAVVFSVRHAVEYHAGEPGKVAAYKEFLEHADLVEEERWDDEECMYRWQSEYDRKHIGY